MLKIEDLPIKFAATFNGRQIVVKSSDEDIGLLKVKENNCVLAKPWL